MAQSVHRRFWSKVEKARSGCWEWSAGRLPAGYGLFWRDGGSRYAHRTAWELKRGPIPEGLHVMHQCDNPACVRPSHLRLGTNRENIADKIAKGRQLKGARIASAKLNDRQVRDIRKAYAYGNVTQAELAQLYGVSQRTVHMALSGRGWKHVA